MPKGIYKRIRPSAKKLLRIKRNCLQCNKEFECRSDLDQRFDSRQCANKYNLKNKPNWARGLTAKNDERIRNKKSKKIPVVTKICLCGCWGIFKCKVNSKQLYINGHYQRTQGFKNDMKEGKGRKNNYPHSVELSKIKSEHTKKLWLLGKVTGWPKGKHRLEETKDKIRLKLKGKTFIDLHGENEANQIRKKLRIARIKQIEKNYPNEKYQPNYNPKACEFFKSFDETNNTKGFYAMYGGGEYLIKELGYSPDYINFDLKLIIEVDEKHHFNENGNLRLKDIQCQKEIQELFPHYEFRRIKEENLLK